MTGAAVPAATPRTPGSFWGIVLGLFTLEGLLHFGYRHLDQIARNEGGRWIEPFIEEMTGSYAALALFVPIAWLVSRRPLRVATWRRLLPVYLLAMVLTSIVHTALMSASRRLLWPIFGLGAYDYGDMSVRYWMEAANDVIWFWVFVALLVGFASFRREQQRAVAEAELRAELARAEVQGLERRLHPHFLFNALNTISEIMYDDPAAADRMITGLSTLLRRALRTSDAQEVPLAEELALLDQYLDIMRARFEDKLVVAVDVADDAGGALVPPLLLQPLVENAIRHGIDPRTHVVRAEMSARRHGQTLRLEVRDHGKGMALGSAPGEGIGLSTTARRLVALYGENQRLVFENADGGGLRVTIDLPFHTEPGPAHARPAG